VAYLVSKGFGLSTSFPLITRELSILRSSEDKTPFRIFGMIVFHVGTVIETMCTLEFNHAVKCLSPTDAISVFVNAISTDGFKLTEVSQETDSMLSIYVVLTFRKSLQVVADFA